MNDQSVHIYDIFEHPQQGLTAVRRGFSWSAFLFPALWAAQRGLGMTTLVLFVLNTAAFDVARYGAVLGFTPSVQGLLVVALLALLGLVPGTEGYRWQAEALERKGYRRLRTVAAANRKQALQSTLANRFGSAPILVAV